MQLLIVPVLLALSLFCTDSFACSESGPKEFELDTKTAQLCGKIGQQIVYQIGKAIYPSLKKGEAADSRPSAPVINGGLDASAKNLVYSASSTALDASSGMKTAIFPITISTRKGGWECLYCAKFRVEKGSCEFQQVSIDHCAGGVSYPSPKDSKR